MVHDTVLREVAHRHRGALSGYAFLITCSIAEADAVTGHAIVRAFRRRDAPATVEDGIAIVRREIVTEALARARRRAVEASPRMVDASPLEPRSREPWLGRYGATQDLLSEFTVAQRACVVLTYVDGFSLADCAQLLGLSEGTAGRYLDMARARAASVSGGRPGDAIHTLLGAAAS